MSGRKGAGRPKAKSGGGGGARTGGAARGAGATRADGATSGAAGAGSAGQGVPGLWPASPPRPWRIAAYVGLVILGVVVGTAGSLVQSGFFPGGLVLALVASAALFYGGRTATGTAFGVGAPAAGWLIAVIVLSLGRPEGDGVFDAGLGPVVYLLGGALVAVMCATMSRSPQPGQESGRLGK
ncbi:DUF6113 family protein [Streptomyces sp. NBC_01716]|uniref:DUF6113 family protein n=1 Tax=Streptomyces sp. NBC_01716 TaxID=2975917 RepID=UPI002E2F2F4A|nr:DUF6113 family protein [Streptomyces sp. NBC_01716]